MWGAAGPDHPAFTQGTSFLPPYDAYERFTVYEMDLPMANWFSSMPTALESAAHSTRVGICHHFSPLCSHKSSP